jgi:hypothetical protein
MFVVAVQLLAATLADDAGGTLTTARTAQAAAAAALVLTMLTPPSRLDGRGEPTRRTLRPPYVILKSKEKTAVGAAVFEGMKLGEVGSPDIGRRCLRCSHSFE